jgi:hypothetical protein
MNKEKNGSIIYLDRYRKTKLTLESIFDEHLDEVVKEIDTVFDNASDILFEYADFSAKNNDTINRLAFLIPTLHNEQSRRRVSLGIFFADLVQRRLSRLETVNYSRMYDEYFAINPYNEQDLHDFLVRSPSLLGCLDAFEHELGVNEENDEELKMAYAIHLMLIEPLVVELAKE